MSKLHKKLAHIADFKFDLTLDKVLDEAKNAVERTNEKNRAFEEAADDIINISLYLKHYSNLNNIPANDLTPLFALRDQKEVLESNLVLLHGIEKLTMVQKNAQEKYAEYMALHPGLK